MSFDYSANYDLDTIANATKASATLSILSIGILVFSLILGLICIISMWKLFKKANKPGWASIVPIYNIIVMLEIAGMSPVYILLLFLPIINLVIMIKIYINIAKKFGKGTGYALGLMFLGVFFLPMLAFGDATYESSDDNTDASNNVISNDAPITEVSNSEIMVEPMEVNNIVSEPLETVTTTGMNTNESYGEISNNDMANNAVSNSNLESQTVLNDTPNIEPLVETNVSIPNDTQINSVPANQDISNTETLNQNVFETNNTSAFDMTAQVNSEPNVETEPVLNIFEKQPLEATGNTVSVTDSIGESPINNSVNTEPVNSSVKFCRNCGNEMPNIVSICPKCGTENE